MQNADVPPLCRSLTCPLLEIETIRQSQPLEAPPRKLQAAPHAGVPSLKGWLGFLLQHITEFWLNCQDIAFYFSTSSGANNIRLKTRTYCFETYRDLLHPCSCGARGRHESCRLASSVYMAMKLHSILHDLSQGLCACTMYHIVMEALLRACICYFHVWHIPTHSLSKLNMLLLVFVLLQARLPWRLKKCPTTHHQTFYRIYHLYFHSESLPALPFETSAKLSRA